MFGFLDKIEAEALGSAGRFPKRVEKFVAKNKRFPKLQHFYWWFVHNCIAHLFLGICPCKYTFEFHDWTSIKLNAENPHDHKPKYNKTQRHFIRVFSKELSDEDHVELKVIVKKF